MTRSLCSIWENVCQYPCLNNYSMSNKNGILWKKKKKAAGWAPGSNSEASAFPWENQRTSVCSRRTGVQAPFYHTKFRTASTQEPGFNEIINVLHQRQSSAKRRFFPWVVAEDTVTISGIQRSALPTVAFVSVQMSAQWKRQTEPSIIMKIVWTLQTLWKGLRSTLWEPLLCRKVLGLLGVPVLYLPSVQARRQHQDSTAPQPTFQEVERKPHVENRVLSMLVTYFPALLRFW